VAHEVGIVGQVVAEAAQPDPLHPQLLVRRALHRDERRAGIPQVGRVPVELFIVGAHRAILQVGPQRRIVGGLLHVVLADGRGGVGGFVGALLDEIPRRRVQDVAAPVRGADHIVLRVDAAVRRVPSVHAAPAHDADARAAGGIRAEDAVRGGRRHDPLVHDKGDAVDRVPADHGQDALAHGHRHGWDTPRGASDTAGG